jgi:hypothetical protein
MRNITGIELGPASCVLVSARPHANGAAIAAVHLIDSRDWPVTDTDVAAYLRAARRENRFPTVARVVSWSLSSPLTPDDPSARRLLAPIVAAGFRPDAILTPAEALAQLATTRPRTSAPVAWLSINTHGAAIAIVRDADILFSRTLLWNYDPAPATLREQLLQRYTLVSHVAPELSRGLALVRAEHGARVDTVVTCGDLPDLRSLTMPLIEELDLEVETLDSSAGLAAAGGLTTQQLGEWAPALRLAAAAALLRVDGPRLFWAPLAATAALILGVVALGTYWNWPHSAPVPSDSRAVIAEPQPSEADLPLPETPAPAASTGSETPAAPVGASGQRTPEPAPGPVLAVSRQHQRNQSLPDVPALTSILIDRGRRLAMFGGAIVSVGDRLGPRVVVRIDSHAVVLREPSGAEITVLLRPMAVNEVKLGPFAGHGRSPSTRTQAAR